MTTEVKNAASNYRQSDNRRYEFTTENSRDRDEDASVPVITADRDGTEYATAGYFL